jgi:DNA-binding GntR family transcriptional regulator
MDAPVQDPPLVPANGQPILELSRGRVPKAAELLASEMRRMILGRGLAPGTPLPSEAEIIEQRGQSRVTAREALRLLEAEGLIEVRRGPRGGVLVGDPRPAHVARSAIDGMLAGSRVVVPGLAAKALINGWRYAPRALVLPALARVRKLVD